MNWKRGAIRTWIFLSIVWIAYMAWTFFRGCSRFPDSFSLICATGKISPDGIPYAGLFSQFHLSDWLQWIGLALGAPLSLGALMTGTWWVLSGFRHRPPKSD